MRHSLRRYRRFGPIFASTLLASLLAVNVQADEPTAAQPNDDQIRRWVHNLSSESFTTRRDAVTNLAAQGRHAVPAVAEAARSGDRETALRCIEVLSRLRDSDDEATQSDASAALSQLTESEDDAVAQQARGLVEEPADVKDIQAANPVFRAMPVRIQLVQNAAVPFDENGERRVETEEDGKSIEIVESRDGEIVVRVTKTTADGEQTTEVVAASAADLKQKDAESFLLYRKHLLQGGGPVMLNAQALAVGAVNQQVVVTNVNGERRIRAVDGDTQVEIEDKDGKDIRVKVTRTLNGKPMSTEYEAEDLEELKANHPAAAELYEKYGKAAPAFQIQAMLNIAPGPAPQAAIGGGVPQPENVTAGDRIEEALDSLAEVRAQLQELKAQQNADQDALEKLVQKLDEAEQRLFEAQSQLED